MDEQETTPVETETAAPEVTETPVEAQPVEVAPVETDEEIVPTKESYRTSEGAPVRDAYLVQ